MNAIEMVGRVFSRLTVIVRDKTKPGETRWTCKCSCGKIVSVRGYALRSGITLSCGCLHEEMKCTHGQTNTTEFKIWQCMHQRCYNPKDSHFHKYGAKGVRVCPEWFTFRTFFEDMGSRPPNMTLDRKDGQLGYSKSNCRWATSVEQNNNRVGVNLITNPNTGEKKTIREWIQHFGMRDYNATRAAVKEKFRYGATFDDVFYTPKEPDGTCTNP